MLDAMDQVRRVVAHGDFQTFENDRASQMVVERGLEIVSEASRHLPTELKQRHPEIPWKDVANIGNKLRHEYHRLAQPTIWKTASVDIPVLEKVCRVELENERKLDLGREPNPLDALADLGHQMRVTDPKQPDSEPDKDRDLWPDYSRGMELGKKRTPDKEEG